MPQCARQPWISREKSTRYSSPELPLASPWYQMRTPRMAYGASGAIIALKLTVGVWGRREGEGVPIGSGFCGSGRRGLAASRPPPCRPTLPRCRPSSPRCRLARPPSSNAGDLPRNRPSTGVSLHLAMLLDRLAPIFERDASTGGSLFSPSRLIHVWIGVPPQGAAITPTGSPPRGEVPGRKNRPPPRNSSPSPGVHTIHWPAIFSCGSAAVFSGTLKSRTACHPLWDGLGRIVRGEKGEPMFDCPPASHTSPTSTSCNSKIESLPRTTMSRGTALAARGSSFNDHFPWASALTVFF